ncbi:MAG: hypothetical protein ACXABM_13255 [Candidatus Thorarchaeota archaeon]|jgi:hypothetical protein
MERFSGTIFGLKRVGKYLTDGDLRKAYAEYKESEETALRLIVNTVLAEGWIITLSNQRTIEELAKEHSYTNMRLLGDILGLLVSENIVSHTDGKYQIREVKTTAIRPEDVGSAMTNFYYDCSKYLPAALSGKRVSLEEVPRVVLETVFSSTLTEKGRGVLLRSFSPKKTKEIGVSAFADVGLPFALKQIDEIFNPDRIHLFLQDLRWFTPLKTILQLLSLDSVFYKLVPDLLGRNLSTKLDLFYGEEIFSYSHDTVDERVKTVADYLGPGGRLVTNDPTLPPDKTVSTPAYVLMQTIEGYPQPLNRKSITNTFQKYALTVQTIGDNWIIASKEGATSG